MQRYLLRPDVLQNIEERQQEMKEKEALCRQKKIQEYQLLKTKVTAIRETMKRYNEFSVAQLKVMVTWFKDPGNLPLPTSRLLLIVRVNQTSNRGDPQESFAQTEPLLQGTNQGSAFLPSVQDCDEE